MKKKIELDVDFIGGGPTPTKEEFLAISEFIRAAKVKRSVSRQVKPVRTKRKVKEPV
ncbi:MAG: hypothetical protein JNM68_01080 [Dinghuibacter sp.]|nr:hypothetical protein [Dinghuibacter sp.]